MTGITEDIQREEQIQLLVFFLRRLIEANLVEIAEISAQARGKNISPIRFQELRAGFYGRMGQNELINSSMDYLYSMKYSGDKPIATLMREVEEIVGEGFGQGNIVKYVANGDTHTITYEEIPNWQPLNVEISYAEQD